MSNHNSPYSASHTRRTQVSPGSSARHTRKPRSARSYQAEVSSHADLKQSLDIWVDALVHKLYGILIDRFEEIWLDCEDMKGRDMNRPEEKRRLKDFDVLSLFKYQLRKVADWPEDIQKEECDAVMSKFPKLKAYLRNIMGFKLAMVGQAQLERTPDSTTTLKATMPDTMHFIHNVLSNFAWEIMKTEEKYGDKAFAQFKPSRDRYKRRYRREKAARFARTAIFNTLDELLRVANALDDHIMSETERRHRRRERPPQTPSYIRTPKSKSKRTPQRTPTSDLHHDREDKVEQEDDFDEDLPPRSATSASSIPAAPAPTPASVIAPAVAAPVPVAAPELPAVSTLPLPVAPVPVLQTAVVVPQQATIAKTIAMPAPTVTVMVPEGSKVTTAKAVADDIMMVEKEDEVGENF